MKWYRETRLSGTIRIALIAGCLAVWYPWQSIAADMRASQVQAAKSAAALRQKAAAELQAAEKAAADSRARIRADKAALKAAIAELKEQTQTLRREVSDLSAENERLGAQEADLTRKLAESDSVVRELVGVIRINAKDLDTLVTQNLQTAVFQTDTDFLSEIAEQSKFPGMADIRKMVATLFDQITQSGTVSIEKASMVDRSGREISADILLVGCFTAAYHSDAEIGFLNYSATGKKFYALSQLPTGRMQQQIKRYMTGGDEVVPMDISRGAALRQLTHDLRLWEQIPKGGPIVWPILLILLVSILIVVERVVFLLRRGVHVEPIFHQIEKTAAKKDWAACGETFASYTQKPVIRVMQAGLNCRDRSREELENALQEAILKEIPPMERFLSTLGMLAAIAPLLGLLGTVTGMIDTFHVITQYGTGDPRMMSGGISEALVTTMLGLAVAIPIMLAHTLLSRAVENNIGQMEEKAVALTNIIQQHRDV